MNNPHPPLQGIGNGRFKACHLKGFTKDGESMQ